MGILREYFFFSNGNFSLRRYECVVRFVVRGDLH